MACTFSDGDGVADLWRLIWHRACGGAGQWHNRVFTAGQSIEWDGDGWLIRWPRHGTVRARAIGDLPRRGETASILASGPSVAALTRPERLFSRPVACVNGSVLLAREVGHRPAYYFVSDQRFIAEKPEIFRVGMLLADAVVLGPMAMFTALQEAPDALRDASLLGTPIFLREDVERPFKRPRPTTAALRCDPDMVAVPGCRPVFSCDPSRGTGRAGTVVYDALQVLYGIGYQELFMFGVDLAGARRFYAEANPAPSGLDRTYHDSIEPAFRVVGEYLRRTGRTLVNGSTRSRLPADVIPKADGDLLLGRLAARSAERPTGLHRRAA